MKRESFHFSQDALRNVHISGDSKILQLCLKKDTCIAKRRIHESASMVVLSGVIRIQSAEREELLHGFDGVILEPAEEHAIAALEDSVVLLILIPRDRMGGLSYNHGEKPALASDDWKEQIVTELRVIADEHERVLAEFGDIQPYDTTRLEEVMKAVSRFVSHCMVAEDKFLFPLLAPYLGGEDVGPISRLHLEHKAIRDQYERCLGLYGKLTSDTGQVQTLFDEVDKLTRLLSDHLDKEDYHLLPMAGRLLSAEEKATFLDRWTSKADMMTSV
ncbi:hemerythrin domain-containing protein [Alicyclobacillus cycloheptanicus]|uniref:Hemerythrin-like domain-containing protein n=1 Tax=Alicyclobacillus cycloheptanicus TaxID=1457 RepID=A0ABT9XMX0_9BACL|nr:hemerythrin domain-containing protein [Alicyclobacillus cycloheptanicus]MDQ0191073.1 hemerythrin-like domain-containing protein [Alicyclobacillus cycloheptanicus]WDM00866.1 hemerythrin domain-containing protein [Alicyclobacillus cycloheptanicus]